MTTHDRPLPLDELDVDRNLQDQVTAATVRYMRRLRNEIIAARQWPRNFSFRPPETTADRIALDMLIAILQHELGPQNVHCTVPPLPKRPPLTKIRRRRTSRTWSEVN